MTKFFGQFLMFLGKSIMMTQSQSSCQETNQFIHFWFEVFATTEQFSNEQMTRRMSSLDKPGHHTFHGTVVVCSEKIFSFPRLQPLFEKILVIRISTGSESDGAVGSELTVVGVDEDWN